MPSVLSSIFDPAAERDGGSQHDSSVTWVGGGGDFVVDQDVALDADMSYQGADGSTHSWQFENDVGVHADVGATVSAVLVTQDYASGADD